MNRPTIPRTHANQAQTNLDIINFVAAHQPASYDDLFAKFADHHLDSDTVKQRRFSIRLGHLLEKGKLSSDGRGRSRLFYIGPEAGTPTASAAGMKKVEHHQPAPLPCLNLSRLPANVLPSRSPVLRPGALDYKSVASHGFRC